MAIISKTDRQGIDVAIEAIQQAIYNDLTAFWDVSAVYDCYPRANKNYKEGEIYPEVSLDEKDYSEVLFDDKVSVNSFFVPSNSRDFNTEMRQYTHNISLIFQADLVKLYGQTNRADEEFNNDVMKVLTKPNLYITGENISITETPNDVYSDFTFNQATLDRLRLNDISQNHVVKFDFDIVYRLKCI